MRCIGKLSGGCESARDEGWFIRNSSTYLNDNKADVGGSPPGGMAIKSLRGVVVGVLRASEYRTKASVKPFAQEFLAPVNGGMSNPQSSMLRSLSRRSTCQSMSRGN